MNKASKIRAVIYGVLVALVIFEAFDLLGGYDYIKANFYQPSAEISSLMEKLKLTGRGNRIMRAVSPSLDSRETFNEKCESHNSEVYVLGCYLTGEDTIHLYNIQDEELEGVVESTAAHELLHAVYNRLPFWEKSSLNAQMKSVYDTLDSESDIKTSMDLYSSDDFYDELHSRLGTEIKDLPTDLENHYAAIFEDQDEIVSFFEKYSGTFKKYENELKTLENKISTLQKEIDTEQEQLLKHSSELNSKIEDYNNRVKNNNYTSINTIRAEGQALQKEKDALDADYNALSQKINEYNALITEYNNNVVHSNQIFDAINSNSGTIEELNN
ncbi:hypothetical protein IJ768_03295 [Candidatus Saccharibacteria bacterium]|nr:hypothetical protein [Candidatus Saccharibacteria bacterium]